MIKLKVFLICLSVLLLVFAAITCMETYSLERAIARGFFSDMLDDMQDIGYLDNHLRDYYREKMQALGWESETGDFFAGTKPLVQGERARKERNETITFMLSVRPSRVSQWLHILTTGDSVFRFSGTRPSEYFDQGW